MTIDWENDDQVIFLRVGDTDFESTVEILRPMRAVIDQAPICDQSNERRLIPGHSKLFDYVLGYLKFGQSRVPFQLEEVDLLRGMAKVYGLDELVELVNRGK